MLFQRGNHVLHSGSKSGWKIECDSLEKSDWEALALMAYEMLPAFGAVIGVPRGGIPFATALRPYCTYGPTLIVDDVYTTGTSITNVRETYKVRRLPTLGCVVFARSIPTHDWVIPLFTMGDKRNYRWEEFY